MFGIKKKKKEEEKPRWILIKQGKVKDIDYLISGQGQYGSQTEHIQFKFEDGEVILLTNIYTWIFKDIRIGDEIKIEQNLKFSFTKKKEQRYRVEGDVEK